LNSDGAATAPCVLRRATRGRGWGVGHRGWSDETAGLPATTERRQRPFEHRHHATAADAHPDEPPGEVLALEFVRERGDDHPTAGPDGVTVGDGPATRIESLAGDAHLVHHVDHLGGERLVHLVAVHLVHGEVVLLEEGLDGGSDGIVEPFRVTVLDRVVAHARHRFDSRRLGSLRRR
jgi:hypothetical protein